MIVLGIHGGVTIGQHEPGAALIIDGRVVAACEEERYLRIKSCYGFLPTYSTEKCLEIAGITMNDVDLVVTTGVTYDGHVDRIRDFLRHYFGATPKIEVIHHQMAHLAAAFFCSGMEESLCLSLDATGDGASGMIGYATRKDGIKVLDEIPTSNSLGYFYTLMTYYLGFIDGDEYKVMGLAPYGKPSIDLSAVVSPDPAKGWSFDWGYVRSNPKVMSPFEPLYSEKLPELLGRPNRTPGEEMTEFYRDVASSTQATMEECFMSLVGTLKKHKPECRNLVYAGGTALNCKANRRLLYSGEFDNIYVPPVASDRGIALGCAYWGSHASGDTPWPMVSAYLGSSYSDDHIRQELTSNGVAFREVDDAAEAAAELIAQDKIIGWHQGRSECGARALGSRSILASCTDQEMKEKVNARIKYREEFRPFAPSIMSDKKDEYFKTNGHDFPYMSFTLDAREEKADSIRAVVHVDNTSRVQTVRSSDNEIYYDLLSKYHAKSGVPVFMNTSFNLKGQPIVETPRDALMTFFGCGLDALVVGNFVVEKAR